MRILLIAAAATLALAQPAVHAAGDIEAGKAKSAQCAACHGADGNSPSGAFPILAGQYADYLARALLEYKKGDRTNPIMAGFAAKLSQQDRDDLAAYFSSQKGPLHTLRYASQEGAPL